METEACFAYLKGAQSYPWLPRYLNQMLCALNLIFDAGANGPKPPAVLLNTFGPLFMTAVAVATFESFRNVHRANKGISGVLARAASWFTLLGQRITAGFALPLQRVFISWSGRRSGRDAGDLEELRSRVPEAKYIWAAYVSLTLGMAIPTLFIQTEKFSYPALSIWQPFPLYVLALNIVLPPLFSWTRNRYIPTVLLTALLVGASVRSNHELVKGIASGEVNLREVFLLDLPADTLTISHGAHILFAIDMASVFVLCTFSVLFGYGAGLGGFIASILPFSVATVLLGPGGSFALFWGIKELGRQRALAKATPTLGKLKTN